MNYKVFWVIDIQADTPDEAAVKAYAIQRRRESTATAFEVVGPDRIQHHVDLEHPGDVGAELVPHQVQDVLSGREWNSDTASDIALILQSAGLEIRDFEP